MVTEVLKQIEQRRGPGLQIAEPACCCRPDAGDRGVQRGELVINLALAQSRLLRRGWR